MMLAAVVGCGSDDDGTTVKTSGTPTRSTGGTATPASSPSASAHTLAELAEHPCLAIDPKDPGADGLHIIIDGSEERYRDNPNSCQWGAQGGMVSFTPYPSTDMTKDKELQHLTAKKFLGQRALLGTPKKHAAGSCIAYVSAGAGQSFRLIVTPFNEDAPGPDAPVVAANFAKAILKKLN